LNTNQYEFPVRFELIPEKLKVQVYLHEIDSQSGPIPCWSYVTHGLWSNGQKELIITLSINQEDNPSIFPDYPLKFFKDVYRFAEQGQLVDAGDFTEFRTASFFDYNGLMYIEPTPFKEFEVPSPALAAVLLTDEEIQALKAFGPTRVMARLGQAYRYYPCPPWSDRTRNSLPFKRVMQESILAQCYHMRIPGIRVLLENKRITLRLLPGDGQQLHDALAQIPPNVPAALLTDLDPTANGCLVWEPAEHEPTGIKPTNNDGSRMCGCFIAFCPEQAEDCGLTIEDGFAMKLTNKSWMTFKRALKSRKIFSIPVPSNGWGFSMEWFVKSYFNPIDGLVYQSEVCWNRYKPTGQEVKKQHGIVDVKEIVLLTSQNVLDTRIGLEPLAAYTEAIEEIVRDHFAVLTEGSGHDLLVQFEVLPDSVVDVKIALRPRIIKGRIQDLYNRFRDLPPPQVKNGPIKFQISFSIWGGSGIS
jgi:hypothetical protein